MLTFPSHIFPDQLNIHDSTYAFNDRFATRGPVPAMTAIDCECRV